MTRAKSIGRRLQEVLLNGDWIANTNYFKELDGLSWIIALAKIENLNTVAEITYHVNYYLSGLLTVLKGGNLEIQDNYSFNMTPINAESDWNELVDNLISNSNDFIDLVEVMSDQQLDSTFVDEKYGTYERNLEGVIEHCYYHLGQIVLIKKLVASSE